MLESVFKHSQQITPSSCRTLTDICATLVGIAVRNTHVDDRFCAPLKNQIRPSKGFARLFEPGEVQMDFIPADLAA